MSVKHHQASSSTSICPYFIMFPCIPSPPSPFRKKAASAAHPCRGYPWLDSSSEQGFGLPKTTPRRGRSLLCWFLSSLSCFHRCYGWFCLRWLKHDAFSYFHGELVDINTEQLLTIPMFTIYTFIPNGYYANDQMLVTIPMVELLLVAIPCYTIGLLYPWLLHVTIC